MPTKSKMPPREALIRTITQRGSKANTATYYGVSRGTVLQWCKTLRIDKADLPSPFRTNKRPADEELAELASRLGRATYIAKELGVSVFSVRNWCAQADIELLSASGYDPEDMPIIEELHQTMTLAQIGDKWEVSGETVKRWLRKWRAA